MVTLPLSINQTDPTERLAGSNALCGQPLPASCQRRTHAAASLATAARQVCEQSRRGFVCLKDGTVLRPERCKSCREECRTHCHASQKEKLSALRHRLGKDRREEFRFRVPEREIAV
ncbi:hypothetical protein AVEN_102517-1 [Araneus ventricosus]|uniref:Uncharacterized protein n=1 Tax=Araneus ventricosus TaxID=182803 RepID=A0A4Y2EHS6_ARAVE|nr:hypothetical protein AVEN_102517-1 [Araneus ventricosus]